MKEALMADLKKYEAEIENVNARLTEVEQQKANFITHGRRIEGIVAYLRQLLADELKQIADAAAAAAASVAPAAEPAPSATPASVAAPEAIVAAAPAGTAAA